jgi:HD-like signal output (HDOD) protein
MSRRSNAARPSGGFLARVWRAFRAWLDEEDDAPADVRRLPPVPALVTEEGSPAELARLRAVPLAPAPWDGARAALSLDADDVRTSVLDELWAERDRCVDPGDTDFLQRLARECGSKKMDFPLFPDAALQLDRLLKGREPSIPEVTRVVRREPDLVRRVWLEANGVNYARKAETLDEAVLRIGFQALWRIGMRACMNAPVFRVRGFQGDVNHVRGVSIVTADIANLVTPSADAYLGGLLHGIGQLIVYRAASVRPGAPAPDPALVSRLARRLYPSIGLLVADSWKMTPGVCAAIAFASDAERAPAEHLPVVRAVRAGCIAAHTAAEARAGREVGGLMALVNLPGAPLDAARLVVRAHAAWDGLDTHDEPPTEPAEGDEA